MSNTMPTALQVMRVALQQYHTVESPAGSNNVKYNTAYYGKAVHGDDYAWCASYVWWNGWIASGKNNDLNPFYKNANAAYIQDLTVKHKGGKYILKQTSNNIKKKNALPKIKFGDEISFNFNGGSSRQHTGLVVGVWGDYIYCIEGNTSFTDEGSQSNGGAVALRKRFYTTNVCTVRAAYKSFKWYVPKTPYGGEVPKLPDGRGYFKYGDKGTNVGRLQTALAWANGYNLKADKEFGASTFAEVVIFQVANGLEPDGKFGAKCLKKLNEIIKKHSDTAQKAPEAVEKDENTVVEVVKHPTLYVPTEGDRCYDLSDHQGALSKKYFEDLKASGVNCVILRSSYTKCAFFGLRVDAHFHNNIKNAIKAGMHIGIYHYSSAITAKESPKEAEFCLKTIKPYMNHIDLPVGFDCEFGINTADGKPRFTPEVAKKLGKTGMGNMAKGFCDVIENAGYEPMLYANLTMFTSYLPANIYKTYKVWIAQYNSRCDYKHPYYMWQYTSTNGKLDKNLFGAQDTKQKKDSILPERGYFKLGDKGTNVKEMKKLLVKANEGAHWTIPITDEYDEKTVRFVKLLEDVRHIKMDGEFGSVCLKECKKKVTIQQKIVNRGVSVSRANKYAYGVGERAHRYGDPFSQTNTGPVLKKKEKDGEPHFVNDKGQKWTEKDGKDHKHTYENTMCCNPFATMCYGYGGGIEAVLKALKKGSGFGMSPATMERYGLVKVKMVKDAKFEELQLADVLVTEKNDHMAVYTGGGWLVEAYKEGWGADTIKHREVAHDRFNKYKKDNTAFIMRYPKK